MARSRPGGGLRLLDARHHVMAEFHRDQQAGEHGFPQANMFHQPERHAGAGAIWSQSVKLSANFLRYLRWSTDGRTILNAVPATR